MIYSNAISPFKKKKKKRFWLLIFVRLHWHSKFSSFFQIFIKLSIDKNLKFGANKLIHSFIIIFILSLSLGYKVNLSPKRTLFQIHCHSLLYHDGTNICQYQMYIWQYLNTIVVIINRLSKQNNIYQAIIIIIV